MFVWFIKEKGLVPDALFEKEALEKELLNTFDADSKETHYYKAILQNLFFATLNQTHGKRQFRTDKQHRNTTTLMRYESSFQSPEKFIQTLEDSVPFMNGGLFECLDKPHPTLKGRQGGDVILYEDGFSDRKDNALTVPDCLFFGEERVIDLSDIYGDKKRKKETVRGIISILNSYKFTIVENTPIEQEIALDPELLGKVFENLLASYNPETKTTARKQTGSFYTPRTIVDYMVDESLKAYLQKSLTTPCNSTTEDTEEHREKTFVTSVSSSEAGGKSNPLMSEEDAKEGLEILFAYTEKDHPFLDDEKHALIAAIDSCKILDPACGSGAFPMGILHKLEFILGKLDPDNALWRDRQIEKVDATIAAAEQIDDASIRDNTITELESQKQDITEAFSNNELGYGRKLYLIENCIYGVDIQSIATQVSKLRFFISLIVDQKVAQHNPCSSASICGSDLSSQSPSESNSRSLASIRGSNLPDNFGIRPLPNLEIKFATANTLIKIEKPADQGELFENPAVQALEKELKKVRHNLFNAKTPSTKRKHRQRDKALREQIASELEANGWSNASARQLADWDPYDQHASSPFFDPEWMFDLPGFDIVIGNPPYVLLQDMNKDEELISHFKATYKVAVYKIDLYHLFIERASNLLKPSGGLAYITPSNFTTNNYAKNLRKHMLNTYSIRSLLYFDEAFDASVNNIIIIAAKPAGSGTIEFAKAEVQNGILLMHRLGGVQQCDLNDEDTCLFNFNIGSVEHVLAKKLSDGFLNLGSIASVNFGMQLRNRKEFPLDVVKGHDTPDEQFSRFHYPCITGRDIKRWHITYSGLKCYFNREAKRGGCWNENIHKAKNKVVIPQIGAYPKAGIDSVGNAVLNTAFMIYPSSSKFSSLTLLAVINSKVIKLIWQELFQDNRKTFPKIKGEYLKKLPIPSVTLDQQTEVETRVEQILALKKESPAADVTALETEIDQLVYQLYDLTEEEIAIVEGRS